MSNIHSVPELGQLLRRRRLELGLSVKKVANAVGRSETTVKRLEKGQDATLSSALLMCSHLGLSLAVAPDWEATHG